MKFLGVAPGPVVGEALAFLLELRLDEGPMSEDDAYERLAAWAAEQGFASTPAHNGQSGSHKPPTGTDGVRAGYTPSLRARHTIDGRDRGAGLAALHRFRLEQHVDAVSGAVQRREDVGDRARTHA